ncbi:MAG TPA: D-sedoheptulose 7-phosphate isomerase [Phaeodactylibacter sp.]|nr:D-sedoheptulose 7-phosphate isomerase [Phaeodactylibacter sp.]
MKPNTARIQQAIQESITVKQALLDSEHLLDAIAAATDACVAAFRQKGKVLFCGNGGSAADAQHLAAELSGRFYFDRPPLFAEALHVNSSFTTAVSNDYGYDYVFARMVEAVGREGDILFALSTSGNSPNVLRAIEAARECGMTVIGMTGQSGGKMREHCDILLDAPSSDTPRIQECHMLMGHIICELVEKTLFTPGRTS